MQYTTKDGDRLDTLCVRHYGTVNNTVEAVLYDPQNYDLATTEVFDAGVTFTLPVVKPQQKKNEYSLWE
ncbi:tail protein X [Serratia rhizosphaerae]|uniref:Phage tail protein n=1 Tax=Serratia rhizosphaerae TaxID=2597702 RepID=A0ABX6GHC9_9GAMM|nr:tail protein X [Serratia rhizosphaerae]QHA85675.1 phage tail protein [Serratia rhizosphaerae]